VSAKLSRLGFVGAGKETVQQGTPVVPTFSLPVKAISFEDVIDTIIDDTFRGNPAVVQGVYGGASSSTGSMDGYPYPDTFGHLLAALGMTDTLGAVVGGKTPHTFKAAVTQPPTYTLTDFDAVEAVAYPGCMLDELTVKVDMKGAVAYTAKWLGWQGVQVATPIPVYGSLQPFLGWQLIWTAGGVASTRVQSSEWTFKRGVEIIPGSDGTQGPRETFADALDVTCKFKAIFENRLDYDRFIAYVTHVVVGSLVQPVGNGGNRLDITISGATCNKATRDQGQKYAQLDCELIGSFNATDGGPAQVALLTPTAAAF